MRRPRDESLPTLLLAALEAAGVPGAADACRRLEDLAQRIRRWNRAAGLVSAGDEEPSRLFRHFHESLLALPHLPLSGRLVDLGSGGGFPGLVWGATRTGQQVTLIESSARRAGFLRDAVHGLGLGNADVIEARIEKAEDLVRLEPAALSTRATGMGSLMVAAGLACGRPGVRVCLYLGRQDAERQESSTRHAGYRVAAHLPLGGHDKGMLLVLESMAASQP